MGSRNDLKLLFIPLICGIIGVAVMYRGFSNEFVLYDDLRFVMQSPNNFGEILNLFTVPGATDEYHPMMFLSYSIDRSVFGHTATGYKTGNLIIYLLTAFPLFFLVLTIFPRHKNRIAIASLSTALFMIHPLHAEPVCWIAGRKDLLTGLFGFSFLLFFSSSFRRENNRLRINPFIYLLSVFLWSFTVLSKVTAIGLLFAAPLLVYAGNIEFKPREMLKTIPWPHLFIALFFIWLNYNLLDMYGQFEPEYAYSMVPYSWGRYLGSLILPVDLTINISELSPAILDYLSNIAIVLTFFGIGIYLLLKKKWSLLILWAAAIFTFAPTSNLIRTRYIIADRYFYLTSFWLILLISTVFIESLPRFRKMYIFLLSLWPILLIAYSVDASSTWQNPLTLWSNAFIKNPQNEDNVIHYIRATIFNDQIEYATELLKEYDPEQNIPQYYICWASLYIKTGDNRLAQQFYEKALSTGDASFEEWITFVSFLTNTTSDDDPQLEEHNMALALKVADKTLAFMPNLSLQKNRVLVLARLNRCDESKQASNLLGLPIESDRWLLEAAFRCAVNENNLDRATALLKQYSINFAQDNKTIDRLNNLLSGADGESP